MTYRRGLQGVQSVMGFLLRIPLQAPQKITVQGVIEGADHQQDRSLLPWIARIPDHHKGLQGVQIVVISLNYDQLEL